MILPKGAFHIKTKCTSHFSFPFESSSAYFQNPGRLFICGGTHFEGDDYIRSTSCTPAMRGAQHPVSHRWLTKDTFSLSVELQTCFSPQEDILTGSLQTQWNSIRSPRINGSLSLLCRASSRQLGAAFYRVRRRLCSQG